MQWDVNLSLFYGKKLLRLRAESISREKWLKFILTAKNNVMQYTMETRWQDTVLQGNLKILFRYF